MISQCRLYVRFAALALLAGCSAENRPAAPVFSAAALHNAESHAYWRGFAAGQRQQKHEDAAAMAAMAAPPARSLVPAVKPMPPPADAYAVKGPVRPIPIHGD